ncbi:hypothetical protein RFI_12940 [Reticulomyxa filosa]|uniref:Uncharacterized protein n=1 Tax=Reticulomyxa filosa TaxID=46433 RepID=X6NEM9_RETFI|nr:hypothetical protein RFI_12940 [Reticulomyxa filosa]|eukprot:ETO24219.1 hypothetical protein RFI_12940 [Reticulomyxa filosa]
MTKVAQTATQLGVIFYSVDASNSIKIECFEMLIIGIAKIIDPFVCPINVVTESIHGFEEVCKAGLPKFSSDSSEDDGVRTQVESVIPDLLHANEDEGDGNGNSAEHTKGSTLRIWSVLGDIISIAFRLQEQKYAPSIIAKEATTSVSAVSTQQQLQDAEKLIDLKVQLLEILMKYILPFGHFAPSQLKQRIVLLLNTNCSSDVGDTNNLPPQRQTRVAQACISAMFELCDDTLRTRQKYDIELSSTAYSLLIPKIAQIFDHFIEDEVKLRGPLPTYRQQEITHILRLLSEFCFYCLRLCLFICLAD